MGPSAGGVLLDGLGGLLGFAGERDGRFVRVRHHRAVRGVSGLGELNEEIRREAARFNEPLEGRFERVGAARRRAHHESDEQYRQPLGRLDAKSGARANRWFDG